MSALILHRVKNGFLVAAHNARADLDLAEAFVAHSAAELIDHIEAHFRTAPPAPPLLSADSMLPDLKEARLALDDDPSAPRPAEVQS